MADSLSLLHPLKVEIVEFLEDEHDLQFKVELPALLDFDDKHRMTKRCHAYVIKHAMTSTNSAVARDLGVDESVVRRALRDYCADQFFGNVFSW